MDVDVSAEVGAVAAVLRSPRFGLEDEVDAFEADLQEEFGGAAAATSSGSAAIHLVLRAAGIEPGDEVVVPAYTCRSVPDAVRAAGARPVFGDVSLPAATLDPEHLASRITSATRAIIAVDQYGCEIELSRVATLAAEHEVLLIHDVAASFGLTHAPLATGVARVASFHPSKVLRAGEGGVVLSADGALVERIRYLRSPGALGVRGVAPPAGLAGAPGFSMRMSDLDAAVARVRLRRLAAVLAENRRHAQRLSETLSTVLPTSAHLPRPDGHAFSGFPVIFGEPSERDGVLATAQRRDLRASAGYQALHDPAVDHCPGATSIARRLVLLPTGDRVDPEAYASAVAAALAPA